MHIYIYTCIYIHITYKYYFFILYARVRHIKYLTIYIYIHVYITYVYYVCGCVIYSIFRVCMHTRARACSRVSVDCKRSFYWTSYLKGVAGLMYLYR